MQFMEQTIQQLNLTPYTRYHRQYKMSLSQNRFHDRVNEDSVIRDASTSEHPGLGSDHATKFNVIQHHTTSDLIRTSSFGNKNCHTLAKP